MMASSADNGVLVPASRILVVEDDAITAQEIVRELEGRGLTAIAVHDGEAALAADPACFDLVTLDRMLPRLDGLAVVARMRERGVSTPVLMVSALSDVDERIAGLRAGGDDYLVKPFSLAVLATRVEVLLRRAKPRQETALITGPLRIDLLTRVVTVDGEPVRLLAMEYKLLEFLARHPGQVVSRQLLFEQVWGYFFDPGANLVNVHIARLRRKLDRPGRPSLIETVKGEGYRLVHG
jgi:two-component system OmpR family response regulator